MPAPTTVALPASGSTAWYTHYSWLHAAVVYVAGLIDGVKATADGAIQSSKLGQANGPASLDSTGRMPAAQLPAVVLTNYATLSDAQAAGAAGQLAVGQVVTVG